MCFSVSTGKAIGQLEKETEGERRRDGGWEGGRGEGVLVNMLFVSAPITVSLKQGDSGRVEKEEKKDSWEEEKEKAANYAKLHFSKMFQSRPRHLPFTSPAVDGKASSAAGMGTC